MRAGATVGAQRHLLAVRPTEDSPMRVHSDGFVPEDAERLAALLLAGEWDESDDSVLVVDVVSARRRYGRLAAFYSPGLPFFPEERALLAAYARHAAVALDAATALQEATDRERTATVLLELAQSLAATAIAREMAPRLAKAVPSVVGADRATVLLYDAESDALRMAGWHGYGPELSAALEDVVIRRSDSREVMRFFRDPQPGFYSPDSEDQFVSARLTEYGSAGIFVVPIIARGDLLVVITADLLPGKPPLEVTDAIRARMTGLADQAATAFENARLLEREREAVATLREADRLKSEFLAIVSHELRTPLAVIVGGAKTLRSQGHRLEENEREQLLDAVIRRSEQLRALVEDLLQTTRDFKLQLARVDLTQLASDAVRDLCSAEPGVTVRSVLPGPLSVVADPSRIRQVVDNLLTNATKYAPGSTIEVRVASVDGGVELSVSDAGPGMASEQAARAFEPFYQGRQDPDRWTGGVGLGLYIARRIVEAHGGTIRIESSPGDGTTVRFSLPTVDLSRGGLELTVRKDPEKASSTAARTST